MIKNKWQQKKKENKIFFQKGNKKYILVCNTIQHFYINSNFIVIQRTWNNRGKIKLIVFLTKHSKCERLTWESITSCVCKSQTTQALYHKRTDRCQFLFPFHSHIITLRINIQDTWSFSFVTAWYDVIFQLWQHAKMQKVYKSVSDSFFDPLLPLQGKVKLPGSKYSCGVSAPQGKDYFMMKPTHMLVLLLAWLPNGAVPKKGARSLEVHAQCGKHREKRKGKREWEQSDTKCIA